MHIFLTGKKQVGKTTLIRRALEQTPGLRVTGFRTATVADIPGAVGSVYILPPTGSAAEFGDGARIKIRWGEGRGAEEFPEIFENRGLALLEDVAEGDLILMDEIGKTEAAAPNFCANVEELLDGEVPILGVVRQEGETPLQRRIRIHPNVRLILVNENNRDALLSELTRLIKENTGGKTMKLSARNQLPGTVTKIAEGAVNGIVTIDVNGTPVSATISMNAIRELGLEPGKKAYAVIKATEVMVGKGEHLPLSARNQFPGTVVNVEKGAVNSIVKLKVLVDQTMSATISNNAVAELDLKSGDPALAVVKATSVMVGVDD